MTMARIPVIGSTILLGTALLSLAACAEKDNGESLGGLTAAKCKDEGTSEACIIFDKPRVFRGMWLFQEPRSDFWENARSWEYSKSGNSLWLEPGSEEFPLDDGFYCISFVGRKALSKPFSPPEYGYGHMSMSFGLVAVDRFLTVVEIPGAIDRYHKQRVDCPQH